MHVYLFILLAIVCILSHQKTAQCFITSSYELPLSNFGKNTNMQLSVTRGTGSHTCSGSVKCDNTMILFP